MRDRLVATLTGIPPRLRRTLTWDQGKEMARHRQIAAALQTTSIYFCEPHSPWQRPSNENTNGLLCDYFPKGTDLTVHTAQDLADVQDELNDRPAPGRPARARIRRVKNAVSVTCERHIAAARADVWEIIADPSMQPRLEPRCQLASTNGDWRRAGSAFTLLVRGVRLHYVVVEADPGVHWIANVDRSGKRSAIQRGELRDDGMGTLLRWTVTMSAGRLTRRLVRRSCERELPGWLLAVEREVLARV